MSFTMKSWLVKQKWDESARYVQYKLLLLEETFHILEDGSFKLVVWGDDPSEVNYWELMKSNVKINYHLKLQQTEGKKWQDKRASAKLFSKLAVKA